MPTIRTTNKKNLRLPAVVLGSAIVTAFGFAGSPQGKPPQHPSKAILLGVGSPVITATRAGTSIAIIAGDTAYVFDAGPGVERRLLESTSQFSSLGVKRFGPVFITHLHLDHTLGLAALYRYHQFAPSGALTMGVEPIIVYGPPGIGKMMDHIQAAFAPLDAATLAALSVTTHELKVSGEAYSDENIKVRAFEVQHKDGPALGFRIESADRVIVISGDSRPAETVVGACNGCDILFHEVFGLDYGPEGPPASGAAAGHTSAAELGDLAKRARPKHLVLYHTLGASPEELIARVRQSFGGQITYGRELGIY